MNQSETTTIAHPLRLAPLASRGVAGAAGGLAGVEGSAPMSTNA